MATTDLDDAVADLAGDSAASEPPGLQRARAVATLLDDAVRIPGTPFRIGLDPIAGLLPVAGDTVAAVASLYIVLVGVAAGLPARTVAKMLALVGADFLLGSVPVVGWVVDAFLKANRRNVAILEAHLAPEE